MAIIKKQVKKTTRRKPVSTLVCDPKPVARAVRKPRKKTTRKGGA